ncbi:hypothetical protein V9L21_25735, partial [Variovorax sp. CCNWLW235]
MAQQLLGNRRTTLNGELRHAADCVEKLALNLACAGDHTEFLIELTMREHVASLQAHLTQSSLPQLLQM